MAMVAERSLELNNTELLQKSQCHECPTLMKHLHRVASDIQKLRKMDFICHCCVEAKMKHDNTAAIAVVMGNDFTYETVRHVAVKVQFLQECVQNKIVLLVYIKTCKNLADIVTK